MNNKAYQTVASYFVVEDIHEAQKLDHGAEIMSLLISGLWLLLHGVLTYWAIWGNLSLVVAAIIHLILCAVIVVVTYALKAMHVDVRYLMILCVASFAAGIFGAFGALLSCLLSLYYNMVSLPFTQWYQYIFPKTLMTEEEIMFELIDTGKDEAAKAYDVTPFMDILALGTEAQKRRALSRMTDQFSPEFAPAYELALKDKSNAIRVQAASSVARIENQFTTMLMRVENLEKARPNDPVVKLGLARFYDSYAFTGLLDKEREKENRTKALDKYHDYLTMKPEDIAVRIEAGRLLLRAGEYDQVIRLLKDCIEAGYGSDNLRLWLIEALYESGKYEELRKVASECASQIEILRDIRPRLSKAIAFWAGKHDAALAEGAAA